MEAQPRLALSPVSPKHDRRDRLVLENLHLAAYVAQQFLGRGLSPGDLLQEARRGLIEAAARFDPARGNKFCTYAIWKCRSYVQDAIRAEHQADGVTRELQRAYAQYAATKKKLTQALNRRPTDEQLATALGWTREQVWQMQICRFGSLSLDQPRKNSQARALIDVLEDDQLPPPDFYCRAEAAARALIGRITDLITTLESELERAPKWTRLFRFRYGLDDNSLEAKSPAEVARLFGVCESSVHNIVGRLWRQMHSDRLSAETNHRFLLGVRQQIDDFIDLLGPECLRPYGQQAAEGSRDV